MSTFFLLLFDALAISVCWLGSYWVRSGLNDIFGREIHPIRLYLVPLPFVVIVWLVAAAYHGLYRRRRHTAWSNLYQTFQVAFFGMLGVMALAFLVKELDFSRPFVIFSGVVVFLYFFISRSILLSVNRARTRRGLGLTRILIVGAGEAGVRALQHIADSPEAGLQIVGFVDDNVPLDATVAGLRILGRLCDLAALIEQERVEEVYITLTDMPKEKLFALVDSCARPRVRFKIVTDQFGVFTSRVDLETVQDLPVVELRGSRMGLAPTIIKRLLDFVLAFVCTLILLPIWLIIALITKLTSKGRVFFRQERVGKDGRIFRMFKFRTMLSTVNPYALAPQTPDDERITGFGRFLRRTSLDETPQLINVLLGHMSMVGPRPEMPFIVAQYEPWQRRRLAVAPGITGLWQIAGRKDKPLHENIEYDFYYIENQSLLLDMVILIRTIPAIFFGKGAY